MGHRLRGSKTPLFGDVDRDPVEVRAWASDQVQVSDPQEAQIDLLRHVIDIFFSLQPPRQGVPNQRVPTLEPLGCGGLVGFVRISLQINAFVSAKRTDL